MARLTVVPVNIVPLTLAQLKQLPPELRNASADEAGEVMMDVEIVAALCPESTINVYFASFDQKGWVDLLDHTISGANGVPVSLSISWGMAEDAPDWSAAALAAINERMHIAAMHGITVCVASGDDGSGDRMSGKSAHVDFPASSPFVLGVGGPLLYAGTPSLGSKVCREIATGNNVSHPAPGKGYKAGPGYDACTGWGVPDGQKLLAELHK